MKTPLLTLILLLSTPLFGKPHMVAEDAKYQCLEKGLWASRKVDDANITLKGANRSEKNMVGHIVNTIEDLTNQQHAHHLLSGLTIVFKDTLSNRTDGGCLPAHQLIRNQIHIARECANGMKIPYREGILIHEIGHFVANKHGFYPKYSRVVKRHCKLTGYMSQSRAGRKHRNRNEEFAEGFAAYLIYGKSFKRKCRQSYNFFKDQVFMGERSKCR